MKFLRNLLCLLILSLGLFFFDLKSVDWNTTYNTVGGVVAHNGDTIGLAGDAIFNTGLTIASGTVTAQNNACIIKSFLSYGDSSGILSLALTNTGITLDGNVTLSNSGHIAPTSVGQALRIAHGKFNLNSKRLNLDSGNLIFDSFDGSQVLNFDGGYINRGINNITFKDIILQNYVPATSLIGSGKVKFINTVISAMNLIGDINSNRSFYQDIISTSTQVTNAATIDLNGYNIAFDSSLTLYANLTLNNIPGIVFTSDLRLNNNSLSFGITTTLDMNGNSIDFATSGSLNIGAGKHLTIRNASLYNLKTGSINFGDANSTLILDNVIFYLSGDISFTTGRINIIGNLDVIPQDFYTFELNGLSFYIYPEGFVTFEQNSIFKYTSGVFSPKGNIDFSANIIELVTDLAINTGKIFFDKTVIITGPFNLNFTGATFKKLAGSNFILQNGATFNY